MKSEMNNEIRKNPYNVIYNYTFQDFHRPLCHHSPTAVQSAVARWLKSRHTNPIIYCTSHTHIHTNL